MTDSMTLAKRDDNQTVDAEQFVAWAQQFDGVDAHIVIDYVREGDSFVPGALNGVTLQWAHGWDYEFAGTAEQPGEIALVAGGAVHVPAGGKATRTPNGFIVEFDVIHDDEFGGSTYHVTRTIDGDTEARA